MPILAAAIIFSLLAMGILGVAVVLPIACIQWTWNSLVPSMGTVPLINIWQATLLYMALGTALYLSGLVHIEFEAENLD